jgi:hypothetical protein
VRPPQPAEPTAPAPPAPAPPQPAASTSENPEAAPVPPESNPGAAPSTPLTAAAIEQLQSQLRDTQSTLEGHLDRVQRLEGVLKEQESMRREVGRLRGVVDRVWGGEGSRVGMKRSLEEDDDEPVESDEEDDVRSVGTVVPHELERVDEEDEEALAEDENNEKEYHRRQQRDKMVKEESDGEESDEGEQETEDRQRRREEDLGVGRPRTPEPSRFGLGDTSRKVLSSSSPLAHAAPAAAADSNLTQASTPSDDVLHSQVEKLSQQVSAVLAFTTTLEAQHEMAQSTIRVLEEKVRALEGLLKESTVAPVKNDEDKVEADAPPPSGEESTTVDANPNANVDMPSITSLMSEWKKSVEGQWSSVQEEWSEERERLARAREEWEARARAVDNGLERMNGVQSSIVRAQELLEVQLGAVMDHPGGTAKHNITTNGGLATPPSPPRSQSSDSGKYARRRRRRRSSSSSSNAEPRSRSSSPSAASAAADVDSGVDMALNDDVDDAELSSTTLAEEDDDPAIAAVLPRGKASGPAGNQDAERMLATPEPSVYKLDSSVNSLDSHPHPLAESTTLGGTPEEVRFFLVGCRLSFVLFAYVGFVGFDNNGAAAFEFKFKFKNGGHQSR